MPLAPPASPYAGSVVVVPNVSALAWDASRKTLWAASTTVGLIAIKAPGAKGMGAPS